MANRLSISGRLDGVDFETFGPDETARVEFQREAAVNDTDPRRVLEVELAFGGEIRIEVTLDAALEADNDIVLTGKMKLFEGTTEGTNDLDGTTDFTVLVPKDDRVSATKVVRNTKEGKNDSGTLSMTLSNRVVAN